jgi:hypothetical protein
MTDINEPHETDRCDAASRRLAEVAGKERADGDQHLNGARLPVSRQERRRDAGTPRRGSVS